MADWKSSSGYFAVCSVHRAAGGQRHQVAQVVVGADQVADEVDLGGDDVDRRDVDVLAVADDVVVAGPAQHRARPRAVAPPSPTKSTTASAPLPPVSSSTCSTWVPSATTPWSAPIATASLSASGLRSTTIELGRASAP